MAILQYAPKMFCFASKLNYDSEYITKLEKLVTFTSCSQGCGAPCNDLCLYHDLLQYRKLYPEHSDVAITVIQRHILYLTQEVVVFALCLNLSPTVNKKEMVRNLMYSNRPHSLDFELGNPKLHTLLPDIDLVNLVAPT